MKSLFAFSLALAMATFPLQRGRAGIVRPDSGTNLASLKTIGGNVSPARRRKIIQRAVEHRRRAEAILIQELKSKSNRVKCGAAYLLGSLRMAGAVDSLSRHILLVNLHRHVNPRLASGTLSSSILPASDALVLIGSPAVPSMLLNIRSSPSKLIRNLSVGVLIGIEGYQVTIFRLRKILPKVHSVRGHLWVSQAIALAQKWPEQRKPLVSIGELLKANENSLHH